VVGPFSLLLPYKPYPYEGPGLSLVLLVTTRPSLPLPACVAGRPRMVTLAYARVSQGAPRDDASAPPTSRVSQYKIYTW
jgi:hypothetical protein